MEIPGEVGQPLHDHHDPEAIESRSQAPRFAHDVTIDRGSITTCLVWVRPGNHSFNIIRISTEKCGRDGRAKEELHQIHELPPNQ